MARYWTSDLHFQHVNIIKYCDRPFKSANRMDEVLIKNINMRSSENDILVHLGDFMCYGGERGVPGEKKKEAHYIDQINPTLINIKGNHDTNNRVNSVADLIITHLGPYTVSASHYPSPPHLIQTTVCRFIYVGTFIICGSIIMIRKIKS